MANGTDRLFNQEQGERLISAVLSISKKDFESAYDLRNAVTTVSVVNGIKTIVETSDSGEATTTFNDDGTGKTITTVVVPNIGDYDYVATTRIEVSQSSKTITDSYIRRAKA